MNLLNRIGVMYKKLKAKIWVYRHRHMIEKTIMEILTPEAKSNLWYTAYIFEELRKELDVIIHISDPIKKKKTYKEFHQRNKGRYEYLFGEYANDFMQVLDGEIHGDSSKYQE